MWSEAPGLAEDVRLADNPAKPFSQGYYVKWNDFHFQPPLNGLEGK